MVVMAGSPLTLTCSAEGNPKPSLSWSSRTADGRSVPRGQGQQLVFTAVSLSEAGWYNCEARNTEGNQTAAVEVTVHGESEALISLTISGGTARDQTVIINIPIMPFCLLTVDTNNS